MLSMIRSQGRRLARRCMSTEASTNAAAEAATVKVEGGICWLSLFTGSVAGGLFMYGAYEGYLDEVPVLGAFLGANLVDFDAVRSDIVSALDEEGNEDIGPTLVRLAWHSSGTFSRKDRSGGSNGSTMRFGPEASDPANAGLDTVRDLLKPIKAKHPGISYADLWTLAGVVAIEEMGGPSISWSPGRSDAADASACPPQGRLPDASKDNDHIRNVFYRMGFSDREIVALSGAHALGRCHRDRSGFEGPWTNAPTTFSNLYFQELLNNTWTERKWDGPLQYEDKSKTLMMLPTDMWIMKDAKFRAIAEEYAKDEDLFFKDFAAAFSKLLALGTGLPEEDK